MASSSNKGFHGVVKAVLSGDSITVMANVKAELPPQKTVTLSAIVAPKLAHGETNDEEFAWQSREFLRDLCLGKEVTFYITHKNLSRQIDIALVYLGDLDVSKAILSHGWAKVETCQGLLNINELLKLEAAAKERDIGIWNKSEDAKNASIRRLPPTPLKNGSGNSSEFDGKALLKTIKGEVVEAFVEEVVDGTTLCVYLLPDLYYVKVFVQGIRAPSLRKRSPSEDDKTNSSTAENFLGRLSKHFVELKVLNKYIKVVLDGCQRNGNFFGSVLYYDKEEEAKDLAVELLQNGLAKYVETSARIMGEERRRLLREAELEAKEKQLRMWENYVLLPSNSVAIHDDHFYGHVIEVVSGDCLLVEHDKNSEERRVYLANIRAPKIGNPTRKDEPAPLAIEAREYLRTLVIGKPVYVKMEFSWKPQQIEQKSWKSQSNEQRKIEFGSVFLPSYIRKNGVVEFPDDSVNVAKMVVKQGLAWLIRTKDLDKEPMFYDALLEAEAVAKKAKVGVHSRWVFPPMYTEDISSAPLWKAKGFLNKLAETNNRHFAIVESVLSGDKLKLLLPKEGCVIIFSFFDVKCPCLDEAYGEEAFAFIRRKIMHHDVQIQVDFVDESGTFFGSLWKEKNNIAVTLLEAGFAKLNKSLRAQMSNERRLLFEAQEKACQQKLKLWKNYQEGKETVKVVVTENIGGGEFYVQCAGERNILSKIIQQLENFGNKKLHPMAGFQPRRGELVLAQYGSDGIWCRAMIVSVTDSRKKEFEVFYLDYGNQEVLPLRKIRPRHKSVSSHLGLAHLCNLAFIELPQLNESCGKEAKEFLDKRFGKEAEGEYAIELNATIEERVLCHNQEVLMVTLTSIDGKKRTNINAALLQEGLGWLREDKEGEAGYQKLKKYQVKAEKEGLNLWQE